MIVNAKREETLIGFSVYSNETGEPCRDIFSMTEYGKLLRKSGDKWVEVPHRGDYVVQYGAGCLEVW